MGKQLNPYVKERLLWLFLALCVIALYMCAGCSPAKISARKDQRSLDRVETNPKLLQAAYARGAELWPCANDTSFIFKPGRVDSLYLPVMYDTADRDRIKDSIMAGMIQPMQDDCNEKIKKAFDLGVEVTVKEFSKQKIPIKQPDTLAGFIVDRALAKSLVDSLNDKERQISYHKGQADQWEKEAGKQLSEKLRLFWLLLGVVFILVASNTAWVFAKIKKPF